MTIYKFSVENGLPEDLPQEVIQALATGDFRVGRYGLNLVVGVSTISLIHDFPASEPERAILVQQQGGAPYMSLMEAAEALGIPVGEIQFGYASVENGQLTVNGGWISDDERAMTNALLRLLLQATT